MMLVDSHCHLDFPELAADIVGVLEQMRANDVSHALCISVTLEDFPKVRALAEQHPNLYASVGTHPDYPDHPLVTAEELVRLADHPKVVAIGETGLDYYRLTGDLEWQRARFRAHIEAAKSCRKPLIIHTRAAAADTIRIMREAHAAEVGGVMHCFTETWETAEAALELGFHISFSGIVTFKNAGALKDVARRVPLERLLVETDSPYLAPVPYRGKVNRPAWVKHVAEAIADLRGTSLDAIAAATSANFFRLFKIRNDGLEAPL
jgi:TatD DNase family protein